MARKFLYVVVFLIVLAIAGAFAYRFWGAEMLRMAMVPSARFEALPAQPAASYRDARMWLARPDKPGNPALWTPAGYTPGATPKAAVFFVHPTSFLERSRWNAPLDNQEANARAELFLRGQASAFNDVGAVWAPRYRQATFGAFLTTQANAAKALDLAYADVSAAFDAFVAQAGDRPIILAGHSQGSLHLIRLLREKIAGKPIAKRIVAAYVVGWPVSRTADLPALGLPECRTADQSGCILSWQSFAEPADPSLILDTYNASSSVDGVARRGTAMICTNPLTGMPDSIAPADANLGTLFPSSDMSTATIEPKRVAARCDSRGLLLIGNPPSLGGYVLPGNNYHVYDYSLFWANVRADAARRLASFGTAAAGHRRQPV
ncbi:DUF3089 domain-containing protein [Sphingomonas sp. PAMC 26617]|uniref:DUF3089 domain-containing protein n=1 Tax=Sphingomonas sp. PAMC 26617 TaxID=1112216 RepID=UPI00028939B0|nr:DUF3089 domain-containing protein [Sphingomonas sp. PAMC 26617]